jgi:kynurenine formamidase
MSKSVFSAQERTITPSEVILTVSTVSAAHVDAPKHFLQKDKDASVIEKELSKDIDALQKVPGFPSIGLENASRFCSLVPS